MGMIYLDPVTPNTPENPHCLIKECNKTAHKNGLCYGHELCYQMSGEHDMGKFLEQEESIIKEQAKKLKKKQAYQNQYQTKRHHEQKV